MPNPLLDALSDADILALTLWGEARNEYIEGIVAVGCVVRNRVRTAYMGKDYRSVCLKPWQFSCWVPQGGQANYDALQVLAKRLRDGPTITSTAYWECAWVAEGLISDQLRNRVGSSRHYHAKGMKSEPKWAKGKVPSFEIGGHLFYEGID